jgi:HSP20 family protein
MLAIETQSPFRELDRLMRRMHRMTPDVGSLAFAPIPVPAVDIYETDDEFVVELEAPGYAEDELTVEVADHTLAVKGAREETTDKAETDFKLHERLDATFERRFALPVELDSEQVTATFGKGVLTVRVPKTGSKTPRTIDIVAE